MHIAICDDNIADRKQLERLLQRESDAHTSDSGGFYIDSFGNSDSLLSTPMTYDIYFIDMTSGEKNGLELTWELRKSGISSPVVLCSSSIYYPSFRNLPDAVYHLDKPLKIVELKEKISIAMNIKGQSIHKIEIRSEHSTSYIIPADIIYVVPKNHLSIIHLSDGSTMNMLGTLDDFYYLVEKEKKFIFARKKLIVNVDYIASVTFTRLKLKSDHSFHINLNDWNFIKKFWPTK